MEEAEAYESQLEAVNILHNAGWQRIYVAGTLVGGVEPIGNVHIKDWAKIPPGHDLHSEDTPDTAHEAAAWLVERFKAPEPMVDNPLTLDSLDAQTVIEAEMANQPQPISITVSPVFNVTGGNATSEQSAQQDQ